MSTLSDEPLYTAYGFRPLERLTDATGLPRAAHPDE